MFEAAENDNRVPARFGAPNGEATHVASAFAPRHVYTRTMFGNHGRQGDPMKALISSHKELVSHFNALSGRVAHMQQQSEISILESINAAQYDQAARYTSVIIVAGYAAFFAMWSSVKDDLSRVCVLWAGVLMMVSIVLFVGFEVSKMILMGIAHQRVMRAAEGVRAPHLASAIQDVIAVENRRILRLWKWALVPTVVFGFGSAAILGWAFVDGLVEWYRG